MVNILEMLQRGVEITMGNCCAAKRRGKFGGQLYAVADKDNNVTFVTRMPDKALEYMGVKV